MTCIHVHLYKKNNNNRTGTKRKLSHSFSRSPSLSILSFSLSFSDTGISKQCKRQNCYACIPLQSINKDMDVMEHLEYVFFVVDFFRDFRCDT